MNRFFAFTQIDVFIKSNQQCFCSCDLDMYGNNSPVIRINDDTKLAPLLTFLSKLSVYLSPETVNSRVQRSRNDQHYTLIRTATLFYIQWNSVHELNSFQEAVREPKCSSTETIFLIRINVKLINPFLDPR
jgi:hypothetical protein